MTDAYVLALAMRRAGVLASLDGGIAELLDAERRARFLEILSAR